jgi:hypothetical protein
MIGFVRKDYIVCCPIEAPEELVEFLVEDLCSSILMEEDLKEMGINMDELFDR